jgi:hypothetical protein
MKKYPCYIRGYASMFKSGYLLNTGLFNTGQANKQILGPLYTRSQSPCSSQKSSIPIGAKVEISPKGFTLGVKAEIEKKNFNLAQATNKC